MDFYLVDSFIYVSCAVILRILNLRRWNDLWRSFKVTNSGASLEDIPLPLSGV